MEKTEIAFDLLGHPEFDSVIKNKLDNYGRGRLSVIKELKEYCDKQIGIAINAKVPVDSIRKSTDIKNICTNMLLKGHIRECIRIKIYLKVKLNNLIKKGN